MKMFRLSSGYGDYADPEPKSKNKGGCGGFRPPKGHMDSQMYPECEGTEQDRDVVKKETKKKKKASVQKEAGSHWGCSSCGYSFSDKYKATGKPMNECPKCGATNIEWVEELEAKGIQQYVTSEEIETLKPERIAELIVKRIRTAKDKAEDFDVNPWAVCHTTVDKDKNPEKYERCVQKVKKKHRKGKKKS